RPSFWCPTLLAPPSLPTRRSSDRGVAGTTRRLTTGWPAPRDDSVRRTRRDRFSTSRNRLLTTQPCPPALPSQQRRRPLLLAHSPDRKSTRPNSSHVSNSYSVLCSQ